MIIQKTVYGANGITTTTTKYIPTPALPHYITTASIIGLLLFIVFLIYLIVFQKTHKIIKSFYVIVLIVLLFSSFGTDTCFDICIFTSKTLISLFSLPIYLIVSDMIHPVVQYDFFYYENAITYLSFFISSIAYFILIKIIGNFYIASKK